MHVCRDENIGRSGKQLTIPVPAFFVREREQERKAGRKNESGITGYRERDNSIGNMSIGREN